MKHALLFASPVVLGAALGAGVLATQVTACNGVVDDSSADGGSDADTDAAIDASEDSAISPPDLPDGGTVNCFIDLKMEDPIDFCFQKTILRAEHAVFSADAGVASSWSTVTGKADTDGGAVTYDVADNAAYGAQLGMYAISAQEYGDTDIAATIVTPDLKALAPLVAAELATLPASYDGELYMHLRRFAAGLNLTGDTTDGAAISALADAYGKAIYTSYFHVLGAAPVSDAGGGDAGSDDGGTASADGGSAGGGLDASVGITPGYGDGILGVPVGANYQYDVDQAASGALALVDLAARNASTDATDASAWASAAASVFNHLYARARHPSGLYYADLITSFGGDHDTLASVVTPNDALLSETQTSVAVSLLRASAIVQTDGFASLGGFLFTNQALSPLNGLVGAAPVSGAGVSLWDPTQTSAATTACSVLTGDAAVECGGSGFFLRYLPSTTGLDNSEKTLRANAQAFEAVHRALTLQPASAIDYEPLSALFLSTNGSNVSFLTQSFEQPSYTPAVTASLAAIGASYTVQANTYAIEALTEQWVGLPDCPPDFF